jgi:hypothetical protein
MFPTPLVQRAIRASFALYIFMTLLANTSRADDKGMYSPGSKDDEKKIIREIAATVIKAAHPTAKKPTIGDYKLTTTKKGILRININVQYRGGFTGVTYLAEISIDIDPKDNTVQELDFLDVTNTVKPNAGNLLKSRKFIENQLDKLLAESK